MASARSDDEILTEIRERYDLAADAWQPLRVAADKCMRAVAGDIWEAAAPGEREKRQKAGRPALSLDEMSQYTNQAINRERSSPRTGKFAPGTGASEASATFYANKMREVESRSKAQIVYTTAFQNAVERGYGWCRIKTRYVEMSVDQQEIWLEEVVDPNSVLPDPFAKRPTHADMQYCFVEETRRFADFTREFPEARVTSFNSAMRAAAPRWIRGDDVTIAEYWTVEQREREMVRIATAEGTEDVYLDTLDGTKAEARIVKRRMASVPYVCMYLTNGVEILAPKTEWLGRYIPLVSCVGKVIYLDKGSGTERELQAMGTLAIDPAMLYCYYRSSQAELVGMTPKFPYFAYKGQLDQDNLLLLQKSLHEPVAVVQVEPQPESAPAGSMLPFPQRNPFEPHIQQLEIGAESARRAIQAAMGGSPLPTSAQRRNEKSGVALRQIEESGELGNFHFADHYQDMIEHVFVVCEDLIDKVYDSARDVAVRLPNETSEMVRINDPRDPKSVSTAGSHQVTISTGPSFASEREEARDTTNTLLGMGDPEVVRAVLPLAIKLKNLGPIGDELVKIAEALQPPSVRGIGQKEGEGPDVGQLMAQGRQMQEQLQHAEVAMKELGAQLQGKQVEQAAKVELARMDAEVKLRLSQQDADLQVQLQRMKDATSLAVAHLNAETKGVISDHTAQDEAMARHESMAHEVAMAEMGARRASEAALVAEPPPQIAEE